MSLFVDGYYFPDELWKIIKEFQIWNNTSKLARITNRGSQHEWLNGDNKPLLKIPTLNDNYEEITTVITGDSLNLSRGYGDLYYDFSISSLEHITSIILSAGCTDIEVINTDIIGALSHIYNTPDSNNEFTNIPFYSNQVGLLKHDYVETRIRFIFDSDPGDTVYTIKYKIGHHAHDFNKETSYLYHTIDDCGYKPSVHILGRMVSTLLIDTDEKHVSLDVAIESRFLFEGKIKITLKNTKQCGKYGIFKISNNLGDYKNFINFSITQHFSTDKEYRILPLSINGYKFTGGLVARMFV